MKKIIFLLTIALFCCLKGFSQAISLTIDCQTPGWLSSMINYGDQQTLKDLTVTGYINSSDLSFIGTMMKSHALVRLDIENVDLVSSNGNLENILPNNVFSIDYPYNCHMEKIVLPLSVSEAKACFNAYLSIDTLVAGGPAMKELNTSFYKTIYQADGINFNKKVKHLVLREGTETIERCTFYNGGNYQANSADCIFESITFPYSLISIKEMAFQGCSALNNIVLPYSIETIGANAFVNTSFQPDTLDLPLNLKTFCTNSFSTKIGQVIDLKENVELFDNESWMIKNSTNLTFVIHRVTPPVFRKGAAVSNYSSYYSDGKELSGCTIYVPKEGYSMYSDPAYDSVGGSANYWSGWANPYSYAKLLTIYINVESVQLNTTELNLVVGNTINLTATVYPSNADNTNVSWTTSNPNVANVDNNGKVTAIASGTATITVSCIDNPMIVSSCQVTVNQPVESVTLEKHSLDMKVGETQSLYAQVLPASADNKKLKWSSSDENTATVNSDGEITAKKAGIATITVVSEDNSEAKDQCKVTVLQPVTGITLSQDKVEMSSIGESIQLEATVLPSDASNKEVKWTSSNEAICFVSNGKVIATGFGTAVVIATTVDGGFTATCTVTVAVQKYKLTYMVDGEVYKSYEIEYGTTITPETYPTKEGYTFSGWSEIPETMPAHDVTVTGSFTINKYKLVYKVDGAEYKSYELEYGATITPEPAPTKEGYTFSGWSEIPSTMPAHDVTVTGSFTKGAYKLTYMVDGEVYKTISYDYGATITPEPAPVKDGYTFSGWSEIPATMPAHDVTVTGSFTINKYKLTYTVDGEEYKSFEIEYGASITPEPTPTKEGYTFSGWSDIPETMPAHDVTVTGSFTVNQYTITYIINDEVYTTQTVDYGSTIIPPAAPEREGYDFAWADYPETMPAYDITIYGTYTTGIETIMAGEANCQIFSLDGKPLNELQKGVNIVRMSNGQIRKVVVR